MTQVNRAANVAQAERWNGASGRYWLANRERHAAGHRPLIPYLFSAAGISPGERVLDIGCGCGETTIIAARVVGNAMVGTSGYAIGLDLSRPMLEFARRLAAQADVLNARFVQGDAQVCPLRQNSCDIVISSFGMMFFEDPIAAFTALAGATRPGGRLTFLCWRDDSQNEFLTIPLRAFTHYTQLPGLGPNGLFADAQLITGLLSSAGWNNVAIEAINERAWMGSDVADVMSYVRGMPVVRRLADALQDEALSERVLADISEQYAVRQCFDGVWVCAAAWLVTASRP